MYFTANFCGVLPTWLDLRSIMSSLPTDIFPRDWERMSHNTFVCRICEETRSVENEFIPYTRRPDSCFTCLHNVCQTCVQTWLQTQLDTGPVHKIGCPVCRHPWCKLKVFLIAGESMMLKYDALESERRVLCLSEIPTLPTRAWMRKQRVLACPWCHTLFFKTGNCSHMYCE